ncbi:hypothetical protein DM01DRAFT_1335496 [Hesseltinella vesiculosa]|uniref:HSF-type DNA-binding domain-containing protein n=1 Tax=Hesseltinella vesiculosa TaxID=101127 RepID=A0A1X2GJN3_9FUNG|nr:hypothetical protein DM01DRAFT_1335496 [Hesseltinella vesiculosa]
MQPFYDYSGAAACHPLSPVSRGHSRTTSNGSDWDAQSFVEDASPTPRQPNRRSQKRGVSTFISKLFSMVSDSEQELISWSQPGSSFYIYNATRFSNEILPEHFKHSNFSSFVRQLNMYGFHKINKSPRGQRGNNENEVWEFSHPKFQYGRTDLLEDIRRKTLDSDMLRRETGDIQSNFAMVQLSQSDLRQQVQVLQETLSSVVHTMEDMKKVQLQQQIMIRRLLEERQQMLQQGTAILAAQSPHDSKIAMDIQPNVFVSSPVSHHLNPPHQVFMDTSNYHLNPPVQHLPPSPANSELLSHSRSSSCNQTYYSEAIPSNAMDFSV